MKLRIYGIISKGIQKHWKKRLKSEEKIEDLYKHIDSLETKANWVV